MAGYKYEQVVTRCEGYDLLSENPIGEAQEENSQITGNQTQI